jgi:UDP-glucose 4-epimerase
MKILFTGASSFTGMHIVEALVAEGHYVVPVFTRDVGFQELGYNGVSFKRVERLMKLCPDKFVNIKFGDHFFVRRLNEGFDAICHHASHGTAHGHGGIDFDVTTALQRNTDNVRNVMDVARQHGVKQFIYTGTYYEKNGEFDNPITPYGLSKTLSSEVLKFWAEQNKILFRKFIIPNPFGPFENVRFTTQAVKAWAAGESIKVKTPQYVRDNIHVKLLAQAYVQFMRNMRTIVAPSGYRMSQAAFTHMFASEIGKRLNIATPFEISTQTEFTEPITRVNHHDALSYCDFDEKKAWDELAEYYREHVIPS